MPPPDTISPEHRLALPVGFQLEEYRIVKVLGQGGFGITYLAEDTRMNHQVAIKELLPTDFATRSQDYTVVPLTQSDEPDLAWAKQRFVDEARILVRLNHPNIVRFFRYFELNSTAYLVMEFVRGQNFKGWIQRHRQPNEQELKALLFPLLDGLEYVHQQPLLHRDISPENVMITEAGRPMLLDFGSARAALGNNPKTEVVRRGFSPIEQYQRNSPQGPYTDLYALAGIMIQAITGEAPPQSIDRFGNRDPYEPLTRRYAGKYSQSFLRALDAAFAAWPEKRPQSVEQWRQMLEVSTRPVKRVWPSLILAGLAVALLISGAIYYFGFKMPADEKERQNKIAQEQAAAQEKARLAKLPKTLVVPDQYGKIQSAIDAAKAGDTVLVRAGVYHEALKFKEGIELRGADRDSTIVRWPATPAITDSQASYASPLEVKNCKSGSVKNLTFEQNQPDLRSFTLFPINAVEIFNSSITLQNARISSQAGNGIYVSGEDSAPTLTANECHDNKRDGISLVAGKAKVLQDICHENGWSGISVSNKGTAPELVINRCDSNKSHGIQFDSGAKGKAIQNVCEQNKYDGILVSGTGTDPELTSNQCRANSYFGIQFSNGSQGKADQNLCEKNLYSGMALFGTGTNPVLTGNQCRANSYDGILFSDGSQGKATGNICEKNDKNGLRLTNASPFLSGNQLIQNGEYGLLYDGASKPSFGVPSKSSGNKAGELSAPPSIPTPAPSPIPSWRLPTPTPTPKPAPTLDLNPLMPFPDDFWPSSTPTPGGTPSSAQGYYDRAETEIEKKEYEQAVHDLTEAIRLNRDYADAYDERGRAYLSLKKYKEAFTDFDRAVSLDPKEPAYYFNRGLANDDLEKYDQAIGDYTKAIMLKPAYAHAYSGRGLVYYEQKKYNEAASDYTEVIRLEPGSADAYQNRGDAYSRLGNDQLANRDYAKAKELRKK
jgi:parallel beta-helix repeat protein